MVMKNNLFNHNLGILFVVLAVILTKLVANTC